MKKVLPDSSLMPFRGEGIVDVHISKLVGVIKTAGLGPDWVDLQVESRSFIAIVMKPRSFTTNTIFRGLCRTVTISCSNAQPTMQIIRWSPSLMSPLRTLDGHQMTVVSAPWQCVLIGSLNM